MIGVIDVGNTRYHCGIGEGLSVIKRMDTEHVEEVASFFEGIGDIMVISVAGRRLEPLRKYLEGRMIRFPMDIIEMDYTGLVGEDRIASALYIRETGLYPCVLVDAGSAITIDIINEGGMFSGGAILPGIRSYLSVFRFQEHLKDIKIEQKPLNRQGKNTVECIRHGIYIYIKGIMDYVDTLNTKRVIVTGGDAHLFERKGWMYDRDVLLKGGLVATKFFT